METKVKRFFITLLTILTLTCIANSQNDGQFEFALYVFPNATQPGTVVELLGVREYANSCDAYLNNIKLDIVERLATSIKVVVPNTHSGFPTVTVGDHVVGISLNQLYVLSPNLIFDDWVPVPLLEDASIVGVLLPGIVKDIVLELYEGDTLSIDLVGINPGTWYPYEWWEPCRIGLTIWPINMASWQTTWTGPINLTIEESGIYIINLKYIQNWFCNSGYVYLLNVRIN